MEDDAFNDKSAYRAHIHKLLAQRESPDLQEAVDALNSQDKLKEVAISSKLSETAKTAKKKLLIDNLQSLISWQFKELGKCGSKEEADELKHSLGKLIEEVVYRTDERTARQIIQTEIGLLQ